MSVESQRQEMAAALPFDLLLVHEAQKGFVGESRALQSVIGPFAAQVRCARRRKLFVDKRHQFAESRMTAAAPFVKELCHAAVDGLAHQIWTWPPISTMRSGGMLKWRAREFRISREDQE